MDIDAPDTRNGASHGEDMLPESSAMRKEEFEEKVQRFEHHRLKKTIVVPAVDAEVIRFLRVLKEPITLFGEGKLDRRERLKDLLTELNSEQIDALQARVEGEVDEFVVQQKPQGIFFTEGTEELKKFRNLLALYSLYHAKERIDKSKERLNQEGTTLKTGEMEDVERVLKSVSNQASEIADTRPVVSCAFSPRDEYVATASWSGHARIWNPRELQQMKSFHAHDDRMTSIVWHPRFDSSFEDSETVHLATGSVDSTAKLWSLGGKLLRTLAGHSQRLARIAMHPMGDHIATCSFDRTWRFWDLQTGSCLFEQEGHSRPVYALAFQCDGALAVSAGLDGYARVWDLRTGRSLTVLKGHAKAILSVDFSPNGYMVATGSEDHTARVYDLRKRETIAILPGHNSLISQIRFDPLNGAFLLTSGYDNVSKLWCGKSFKLTNTLAGHDGKVMCSDLSQLGSRSVISGGYDRTIKLWQPDSN